MHHTRRSHLQLRIVNAVFVLLFLAAVGLLQWVSREYNLRVDLSATARNTLAPASIAVVERLNGPLKITAFASPQPEAREPVQTLVARYRRHKSDIELRFVNPDESPNEVREAHVHEGELVLEHADAKERIAPPTRLDEEAFTNALTRLGHRGERWIVFLGGHGERSPDRPANFDLSTWGNEVRKRGFKTRVLTLARGTQIPGNTSMFVIAGPRTRLLPGEVKEIQRYVEHGGNLLWLADRGPLNGLEPLAETLGVEFLPGTVVDPESARRTGFMDVIALDSYGSHPIVRDFADFITVFPQAGALQLSAPKEWQGVTLLDTSASAWLKNGALVPPVKFDKGKDMRGPLTLAVAFTRNPDKESSTETKREQRVAVIADGDFLANSFIPNAANLDLGMSLVNWLSRDDAYVSLPVRAARDRRLELSRGAILAISGTFLLGLPLVLIGGGVTIWWWRRKR